MILIDTGPLVALFHPKDSHHARCLAALKLIREPLKTTVPVLTETFNLLQPQSQGADKLRDYIGNGSVSLVYLDQGRLSRCFELMESYADQSMDFADASLIVAAEALGTTHMFTLDRRHFETYRIRKGHRYYSFSVVP